MSALLSFYITEISISERYAMSYLLSGAVVVQLSKWVTYILWYLFLLSSPSSNMQTILSSNSHEVSEVLPGQNLLQHHYYEKIFIAYMEVYLYPESHSHVTYKGLTRSSFPSAVFSKLVFIKWRSTRQRLTTLHIGYLTSVPPTLQTLFNKIGWGDHNDVWNSSTVLWHYVTVKQSSGSSFSSKERIWSLDIVHNCLWRLQRKKNENWWPKKQTLPTFQQRCSEDYFYE